MSWPVWCLNMVQNTGELRTSSLVSWPLWWLNKMVSAKGSRTFSLVSEPLWCLDRILKAGQWSFLLVSEPWCWARRWMYCRRIKNLFTGQAHWDLWSCGNIFWYSSLSQFHFWVLQTRCVDHLFIAQFSVLKQTHCTLVTCDSKWVTGFL